MFFSPFLFVLGILAIVFVFAGYAVNRDHAFKLQREQIRAGKDGSSLGASELKGLIQEAVSDAMVPVEERLGLIERQLRQLPERTTARIDIDPEPKTSATDPTRSRVR